MYLDYDPKKLEENLDEIYEARRAIVEEKQNKVREKREAKKQRKEERYLHKEERLKSSRFVSRDYEPMEEEAPE